jgi:hypothetical protein
MDQTCRSERAPVMTQCTRPGCGKWFEDRSCNHGGKYCPGECREWGKRAKNLNHMQRKRRADAVRSTTRGSNGGATRHDTVIKRKITSTNGCDSWDRALPDHSHSTRRTEIHTSSDILHAPAEKTIAMINRILSGKDSYVG